MTSPNTPEPSSGHGFHPRREQRSRTEAMVRRIGRLHDDSTETAEKITHGAGGGFNAAGEIWMASVPAIVISAVGGDPTLAWGMGLGLVYNAIAHRFGEELGTEARLKFARALGIRNIGEHHHGHGHGHGHGEAHASERDKRISKFAGNMSLAAQWAAAVVPLATLAGTPMFGPGVAIAGTAASVAGLSTLAIATHDGDSGKPRWRSAVDKLKQLPLMVGTAFTVSEGVEPLVLKGADLAETAQQPLLWIGAGLLVPYVAHGVRKMTKSIASRCVPRGEKRHRLAQVRGERHSHGSSTPETDKLRERYVEASLPAAHESHSRRGVLGVKRTGPRREGRLSDRRTRP